MGSWGSISFGAYERGDFKSQIPLETLLLFTQEDLLVEEELDEDGDTRKEYSFVTDAGTARRRLDARGLDLNMSKWLYDEFRSDWVWLNDFTAREHGHVQNTLDFARYLEALRRFHQREVETDTPIEPSEGEEDNPDLKLLSSIGFFRHDA